MVAAGVGVSPADEAAPHAAIIERKSRRARHRAAFRKCLPVVVAKGLRYSCLGPDLIRSPFRVVGATGAGSLFSCMAIDGKLVDGREHADFGFWRSVGARRVSNCGAAHRDTPSTSAARFRR